ECIAHLAKLHQDLERRSLSRHEWWRRALLQHLDDVACGRDDATVADHLIPPGLVPQGDDPRHWAAALGDLDGLAGHHTFDDRAGMVLQFADANFRLRGGRHGHIVLQDDGYLGAPRTQTRAIGPDEGESRLGPTDRGSRSPNTPMPAPSRHVTPA